MPLLLPAFLFLSCGIGGSDFAGGGTGGTGISTGAVSGFGSVVVNGVHFRTDDQVAPGFQTKKISNGADSSLQMDNVVFAVGMVVTVRHGTDDNDAQVIEYRRNLQGPIAVMTAGADDIVEILGQRVVVDNAAVFATLNRNDIVEVSGFADNAGRVRAGYVSRASRPVGEFEAKGFVSGLSGNTFRLGPLPDGSGATVGVSYGAATVSGLPGGPVNGMYVEVATTDREPAGGVIAAARIVKLVPRTEFPDRTLVDLEGLITTPWTGSGNDPSFAVEGKRVRWNDTTEFAGGGGAQEDTRQANRRVQVQGIETGGVLSAIRVVFR